MKRFVPSSFVAFAIALQLLSPQKTSAQILWNFDGGTGTAAAVAASIPANITVSSVSEGNASTATPVPNFLGNSPVSSGYTGASGSYAATMTAVINTSVANLYSSTYLEFTLTPASGYQINLNSLQFGTRSTAQNAGMSGGPTSYHIRTSADNYGNGLMTNAGSLANGVISANSIWSLITPSFNNGVTSVTAGLNGAVTVRIYATQVVNNTGQAGANWRIDDLSVTATATIPTATPFYYKGTGSITTLANWGSNTDGTGAKPASFYIPASTYNIANTTGNVNLDAPWFIGGKLNVGAAIALNTTTYKLALGNNAAATFAPGSILNINDVAGVVDFGGMPITLESDATGTASIGIITGTLNNASNVTIQKYIPGGGLASASPSKRAYRFFSHPFSNAIAVSQLKTTNGIDITGNGGNGNGFVTTGSNNPSVFQYNTTAGNGNATADPGWLAFTDVNTTTNGNANAWNQYQGIRALVRGTRGQGLDGSTNYIVGSPTISLTGAINTGDKTVNLVSGGANWNLIGNPYPSAVNLNTVTRANTGNFIYVWKVDQGIRGAYSIGQNIGTTAYNLPAYSAFFVQATGANASMLFHETDKTATETTDVLFRTNSTDNTLKLKLQSADGSIFWDELYFSFNKTYKDSKEERNDGLKLSNPDVSLYSISSDNEKLSVDSRPIKDDAIIPLGLSTAQARSFQLVVTEINNTTSNEQAAIYLKDKLLNTLTRLEANTTYDFVTTADAQTQGEQRFELVQKILSQPAAINNRLTVKLSPNPVRDMLNINYEGLNSNEVTTIRITDMNGSTIKLITAGKVQLGNQTIDVKQLPAGMYTVQLMNGQYQQSASIIKQ